MTTERITVTAADLQPGDVVVEAPRYAAMIGPGHVVERVTPFVDVDSYFFKPDAEFIVERPVPTATLTFDVPESKREAVEQAVQRVLAQPKVGDRADRNVLAEAFIRGIEVGADEPTLVGDGDAMYEAFRSWASRGYPPVKVGDRVRRTLPHGPGDGGRGRYYEPGATGTVTDTFLDGRVSVKAHGSYMVNRTWRAGSFEVVPS